MHGCSDRCVKPIARSLGRNRGSKMRASKPADKVSVSAMIHCSTQGHDLDQERVMEHAQAGRETRRGARKTDGQRDSEKNIEGRCVQTLKVMLTADVNS